MVLKFTKKGELKLQIGSASPSRGSNDKSQLGKPANMNVDPVANEVYVADGYTNKRVIVFDSITGVYKRHWGAYGNRPADEVSNISDPESPQFGNPVHCVRLMNDGTVLVCDRHNNRIQVFDKRGHYISQIEVEPSTRGNGSTWDLVPTDRTQRYILVADGTNNEIDVVSRETGHKVGSFGRSGRNAGDFHWVHSIAVDSRGNVYTGEVDDGKRLQKFTRTK